MNTVTALLSALTRQGVELKAEGDKLLFRPRERVSEELKAKLKEYKAEVIALLSQPHPSCSALADLYTLYWETPESVTMETFQALHREVDILERQVGADTA